MSRMTSQYPERVYSSSEEERQRPAVERKRSEGISTGWLLAGLAVLGLGALAWYQFAPDVRRYIKIRNM
jgi:cytoskeletal protein RodZ